MPILLTGEISQAAIVNGLNITTSPVSTDLPVLPGSSKSTQLQVLNNGTQPINISVKLEKFTAYQDTGQAAINLPTRNDDDINWVHFSQNSFVAQPGVWSFVTMTVSVPKNATLGHYYAVVMEPSAINTNSPSPNTNKVVSANAIFVLVDTHSSNEKVSLNIQQFTSAKFSYDYLPATFNLSIRNPGNIYVVPKGDIYISRDKNSSVIDSLDINSGAGRVLPNSNRTFQVTWTNGFPSYQFKKVNGQIVSGKNGKPLQVLNWDFSQVSKFRFGKYLAHLVLAYNDGTRDVPIDGYVSFWVIPWIPLLIIALFILFALFGVWSIVRAILKRLRPHKK